ncbi:MAG TPA: hypothetical protein VER55_07250, partial [Ardenticatenaceae bacterium]|nr:hypothetical protein [Ardenticatenaceae bacterium]
MLLGQESRKAQDTGSTLRRLAGYFRPYGLVLLILLALMLYNTWTQVFTADLTGQVVDCYVAVTPQSAQNCWFTPAPGPDLAGLGRLILLIVALYVS